MIYTGFKKRDKMHHTLNHFARNPTVSRYLECDELKLLIKIFAHSIKFLKEKIYEKEVVRE